MIPEVMAEDREVRVETTALDSIWDNMSDLSDKAQALEDNAIAFAERLQPESCDRDGRLPSAGRLLRQLSRYLPGRQRLSIPADTRTIAGQATVPLLCVDSSLVFSDPQWRKIRSTKAELEV